jgi:hypothetical protein
LAKAIAEVEGALYPAGGADKGLKDDSCQRPAIDPAVAGCSSTAHRDGVLVEGVLQEGLGGPKQTSLEERLFMYALPVLTKMILDGRISGLCQRLGRPFTPEPTALACLRGQALDDLVVDTIAAGVPLFRK